MYVYACIGVDMYMHVYACICMYMCRCMYWMCMYVFALHVYACMHVLHAYVNICMHFMYIFVSMECIACIHICIRDNTSVYLKGMLRYTCIYIHIHAYTYNIWIYIHIHKICTMDKCMYWSVYSDKYIQICHEYNTYKCILHGSLNFHCNVSVWLQLASR